MEGIYRESCMYDTRSTNVTSSYDITSKYSSYVGDVNISDQEEWAKFENVYSRVEGKWN